MNNKLGFSMVEVLLSLGILVAIMLPIFFTFFSGTASLQITETEFKAHTAALEIMEQINSLPFHLIPTGTFSSEQIADGQDFGQVNIVISTGDQIGLSRSVEISPVIENDIAVLKKITVNIEYDGTQGLKRTFALKSLVANERL